MNQLVIMCGGEGTRLRSLKINYPKCFLKINKKTLLEHQILLAKQYNFKNIILLTSYKSSMISKFLKKKKLFKDIKIIKDKKRLGTGIALLNAINYLDKEFCLIYCDILTRINLNKFYIFFKKKKSDISLVINKNSNFKDSNLVKINKNHEIINLYSYPHKNHPINCYSNEAIFMCKKKIFLNIKKKFSKKRVDFVKDLIPKLFNKIKIFGYKTSEYIIDCGTPLRLEQAKSTF